MFAEIGGHMKLDGGYMKRLSILFSALMLFSSLNSAAHSAFNDNFLVNNISMSEGLPANFVDYIYKDSYGYIWIATSGGGLSRYDGNDFLSLTVHSEPQLKSSFVTCITEDHFHRLWITTENGLDILNLESFRCNELSIPGLQPIEGRAIHFITTDADGNVWLRCGTSIYMVSFAQDGSAGDVLSFSEPLMGLQENFIRDVEGNGSVWTSYGSRIVRLQARNGRIVAAPVIDDLPIEANAYVSDCILKNSEIWISTDNGLFRYNKASGGLKHYRHSASDDKSLSQNFLTDLSVTWDDQLLVSSLKGLNVYDPLNDCFERISSEEDKLSELCLSSDFINCITTYDKQIWIGTESAGITVISPKTLPVKNYVHKDGVSTSIAPNPVNTILIDHGGRVWTGNVEAGLNWSYPGSDTFHHITTWNSGLVHNSVSALECDRNGNLWVGTWGGGISILSLDRLRITRNVTASPEFPISFIGVLKYDPVNDFMWIGSNNGIFAYDIASGVIRPVLEDQPYGCVGACVDEKGRMWIGCQRGLYVFDMKDRRTENGGDLFKHRLISPGETYSDRINCVSVTSDGTIWVGSNGNGIYRLDSEDEDGNMHFSQFSTEQGLANDRVKGIVNDNFGEIWIATDNGLSRFNPSTNVFTNYYTNNGLASSQFYWNASCRGPEGTLYFGQTKGLTVVTPKQEYERGRRYDLRFTHMTVGDKEIVCSDEVRLHQRDRSFNLEFALLDYGAVSSTVYSYRLKGFDDEWITLRKNRRFVSFTNLPAGNFVLQVRAMDSKNELLGENELKLSVDGYFYRSWWFLLIMALAAVLSVMAFVRLRTRHLSKQREELQKTVMERTKEISEQKKLLEIKAEELASQNKILTRQNEELAGHKILFSQESRMSASRSDDKFVEKLIEAIRENYKNSELDVQEFCKVMGMSKTLLNKKMQESLGQSIGQFIRTYRLSIAREMLVNNKESKTMNVSEIAYEVGFNDPKYFTRCFTKEYGTAPSAFSK